MFRQEVGVSDNRSLLARVVNPGVPWWIAVPCNVVAGTALVLLLLDPAANLTRALGLLSLAAVALYGTALVVHVRKKRR
jgi:hypothetical protein